MVRDHGLPAWFPSVFTGGNGYTWEFHRDFDPILGKELAESYKRQPELYKRIRKELGGEAVLRLQPGD